MITFFSPVTGQPILRCPLAEGPFWCAMHPEATWKIDGER